MLLYFSNDVINFTQLQFIYLKFEASAYWGKPLVSLVKNSELNIKFFGNKFLLDNHITCLYRKTSQKIHALLKVASYMTFDKNEGV